MTWVKRLTKWCLQTHHMVRCLWDVLSISVPKDHNIPTSTGWEAMASLTARRVWLSTPLSPGRAFSCSLLRDKIWPKSTKAAFVVLGSDHAGVYFCHEVLRSSEVFNPDPWLWHFPPPKKKPSVYHTHSTSPSREVHRPGCTNSLGMQQIISCCMTAKRSWLVPTEDPTTILCGVWNDLVHLVKFPRMLSFCLNLRIETVGKVRANSSWAAFLRWCWQSEAFRARIHSRHSRASCQPELLSNRVSSTIAVATDCEISIIIL